MEEELFLYKFHVPCGRQGDVEGLFITTQKEVDFIIGKYVYFGEALGKHSEVCGEIESSEITRLDVPSDVVGELSKALGTGTISGYNPLSCWNEERQEDYDERNKTEEKK